VTTALALPSLLPGRLHENGMDIPPDLDFETWESVLRNAEWIERASPWWVVDLVAYGRDKFHEDYSQALPDAVEDVDGFHRAKLAQAEWMADRWPPSTRVLGQSYSAHRAVAKLDRADAVALLHETDKDGRRLPVRVLARRADEIEESIRGQAIQVDGTPVDTEPPLIWVPQKSDLTDEVREALEQRLAGMGKSYRVGYERGAIDMLVWADVRDCFLEWKA
jgi:hypothetical protein